MMMRFIPFALLVLFYFSAQAQQVMQTVKGTVTDVSSKAPVIGAIITLPGTVPAKGTATDSLGGFMITDVAPRRYDVQVSAPGYEPYIMKEVLVSAAKQVILNISLRESRHALQEVTIKAAVNKEQPLNQMATVSTRMLSVEEAGRYAGGFDDPARLASSFAGVGSNVGNNAIIVRGNAPKFLQWKIEGVEVPNPNHFADLPAFGGGGLTALSSQLLANSDFFTGAFPAEYNNALSGVFDINMRNGNNQKRENTFQLGLIGIDAASEGPFVKNGKSSYLFNYRYSTLALLSPILPENAGGVKYQDLSFKLNFPTKNKGTFSVWGIGLIDRSGSKAQEDSTKWQHADDKEDEVAKQYMAAGGLTHKYFFNNRTHLRTTVSYSTNILDLSDRQYNSSMVLQPENSIFNSTQNLIVSSYLNTKVNSKFTTKTGINLMGMYYNILLKTRDTSINALKTLVNEHGQSTLLSAYNSSAYRPTDNITVNFGLNLQLFTLNGHYTIEPRLGLKWQVAAQHSIGLAYGLHSRLERLNYYFTRSPITGEAVNRDLDFTKAHHFVFSYDWSIGYNMHLKVEPYYMYLFNVPVEPGTSYSFINLENDWFYDKKLYNTGAGRSVGIDITLEKYLSRGYYYLFTASLFDARYRGGDNVWRNSRFNRNYLFNVLGGKEWVTGKYRQNIFNVNARASYQGGDHYIPVNDAASIAAQDVVYDNANAFAPQLKPSLLVHFTASYKINHKRVAHTIALKVLNVTGNKEFDGFRYNFVTNKVEPSYSSIIAPNLSYRIDF